MNKTVWMAASLLAAAAWLSGCEVGEPAEAPLAMSVHALQGGSCGDPDDPTAGLDPFGDIQDLTVVVRSRDEDTGKFEEVRRVDMALKGHKKVTIKDVPEGAGLEVEVFGHGAVADWYAKDPNVSVVAGGAAPTAVQLLLTRHGGLSCVPTPTTFPNVVFPGVAQLGDGRLMIAGGFTALVPTPEGVFLQGPSAQALMFDPRTGVVENLGSMSPNADDDQGRAGHAMVYMPPMTPEGQGQVLIYGGMRRLEIDDAAPFPFKLNPADARNDYVIYDVASGLFIPADPANVKNRPGRAFPRAELMADGSVLITGGGRWPVDDSEKYKGVEIYDPRPTDSGVAPGLMDIKNFQSFWPRAGHSLTFIQSVVAADGRTPLTQFLVWGGTTEAASMGHIAEVFTQSSTQREGVNGTFSEVQVFLAEAGGLSFSYFHEVTRLGGRRFLVTGGMQHTSAGFTGALTPDAWVLTYDDSNAPAILVEKAPGLGLGRIFHRALTNDFSSVTVVGGWDGDLRAIQNDTVMFFELAAFADPARRDQAWTVAPEAQESFLPRGGHGAAAATSGQLLLVGGATNLDELTGAAKSAFVEVYTPSSIPGL